MTQPKFPWVLMVIIAMFTLMVISENSPPWIKVLGVIAVITTAAAAIYQVIPRKDDDAVDEADLDPADDPWSDENQP